MGVFSRSRAGLSTFLPRNCHSFESSSVGLREFRKFPLEMISKEGAPCGSACTRPGPLDALHQHREDAGISYDQPYPPATLAPGDQTNRLPIAPSVIGPIGTSLRRPSRPKLELFRLLWRTEKAEAESLLREDPRLFRVRAVMPAI
ncbi:hypothetical protein KM043_012718 [Ampulex compressa]|nr:hypothetical protein KM043_012718 [Ampulex compressa]